jgi:RNA polymerase sigma-70 factor (ECF subfamily)
MTPDPVTPGPAAGRSTARDAELHARVVAGDLAALEELFELHCPAVYGQALRATGDSAQAEDVTREAFAGYWERPMDYDPTAGGLQAYLLRLSAGPAPARPRNRGAGRA